MYPTDSNLYYLQSRYYNPEFGRFISPDVYVSTGQGIVGNNMFAYCNNNPVNQADTTGTIANVIIGAAIGAVMGGLSAGAAGQSILFGAVIGGLAGVASTTVGFFVAAISNPWAAAGVGAAANALIGAVSNTFNQYVNYRLQDKAKRENDGKGSTAAWQSQEDANNAYNAASFNEYYNLKDPETLLDFAVSTALSAGGGAVSGWFAPGGSQTINFRFPTYTEVPDLMLGAAISSGTTMMQILIEPMT